MNTGGPAFPTPSRTNPQGLVEYSEGMTMLDWYAGQALAGFFGFISETQAAMKDAGLPGIKREQVSRECYDQAESMLAEKARREATGKDSSTVQTREVDDDRWAKFQDGFRISFQPTIGWCAEIRDGSMGYGNTIAEAIANLRARWEERSAAPVVQQTLTTQDAAKVAELQEANRELVEALEALLGSNPTTSLCMHEEEGSFGRVMGTWGAKAEENARAILSKHKGGA